MDIRRALRQAVSTGTVYLGTDRTLKALKDKKVKLIVYSKNVSTPQDEIFVKHGDVPKYMYQGTNFELGAACGKPFPVAVLSILNPGDSDILALIK